MSFGLALALGALLWGAPRVQAEGPRGGLSVVQLWPFVASARLGEALPALLAQAKPVVSVLGTFGGRRHLPRVRLPERELRPLSVSLVAQPPFSLRASLPQPHSFRWDVGMRAVYLHPDFRVTQDRRGAYFGLRGVF